MQGMSNHEENSAGTVEKVVSDPWDVREEEIEQNEFGEKYIVAGESNDFTEIGVNNQYLLPIIKIFRN